MTARMTARMTVRRAAAADAAAITRVHIRSWRESYADHFPADLLADLEHVITAEIWESTIRAGVTDVLVAEHAGEIIGWAAAGPGRDEDAPVGRELEGIYVLSAHHGTGVGHGLIEAILGGDSAYLWILERNPRAETFYLTHGFERDGAERATPFAGHTVDAVRMVRSAAVHATHS